MSFPTSPDPGEAGGFDTAAVPTSTIPEDDEATTDLPLTMAASMVLTTLPRDAHAALREATELDNTKVKILFRAGPGAPTLADPRGRISASQRFERVVMYLRKRLGCKPTDNLFLYVNSVFAPALDENVGNLFRCFSTNDQLVVSYSLTPAFG